MNLRFNLHLYLRIAHIDASPSLKGRAGVGSLLLFFFLPLFSHSLTHYVDPRIGSEGEGRVFIGPSAPFGMVKPGPDAISMPNAGWAPMPEAVKGFSQTHVSGTGGGQKYGNVLIQPILKTDKPSQQGVLMPDGTVLHVPVYEQMRRKEKIALGYYACTYYNNIKTEITTTPRCAFYRFRHADALFIDPVSFLGMDTIPNKREGQFLVAASICQTGTNEVSGYTTVRGGWNNGDPYRVYFCIQSRFSSVVIRGDKTAIASFSNNDSAEVKIGISYVSVDQARKNISGLSFDEQRRALCAQWETRLGKVTYQGSEKEMRMFYTALYHTLLMPVDKTGEAPSGYNIHKPYFDDYYAIWDTYRTSFPLLMEYYPEDAVRMINALLNIYQHDGYMPDARSGDCNGRTQGGSNAEVVIAEAFARGLKGIDYNLALKAMLKDAEVPPTNDEKEGRGGLKEYNTLGYVPYGIPRAGTRTVEYSYDDWCIAQVAKGLGKEKLYRKYLKRSKNWQNLWRSDYKWQGMRGFIMPKDAKGHWLDSVTWGHSKVFSPKISYTPDTKVAPWYIAWWDTFFYEALSAEYSLSIPHDIPTLIKLCGGDSAFCHRLDIFFDNEHYNVGNEPSFLTPYLYAYIGRTDLASKRVASIVNKYYSDTPDGLPGNDDSGAMSSWLIWAMLGKYPVAGQDKYISIQPVHMDVHSDDPSTVSFVLNRQYRTWKLNVEKTKERVIISCNGTKYIISEEVVENATGFCWDSPQKPGKTYRANGTFLFISRQALKSLQDTGQFVYDRITWRKIAEYNGDIKVAADVDGSVMWIDTESELPWVLNMKGNPLGIDWTMP